MKNARSDDVLENHFPKLNNWDKNQFLKIYNSFPSPKVKSWARLISFTADPRLWGLYSIIFGIYGLISTDFSFLVIFIMGFFQTFLTYQILKKSIKRPRPFYQFENVNRHDKTGHGYSFPSGHVHHSAIFVILIGFVFLPYWWYFLIIFTYHLLVALTRLINGCHFPIDTLFAIFEAYIEIFFFWFVTKKYYLELYQVLWSLIFG